MKFTLKATMIVAALFALACLIAAVMGFNALSEIPDPVQAADTKGYAWFWMFLAMVGAALAVAAWWFARSHTTDE